MGRASAFHQARTVALGLGLLFIALCVRDWSYNFGSPNFTDYLSHWAAGKLALAGDPAAAYDLAKHRTVELSVVQFTGSLPFPYPPPFLLLVTPFSLLPYMWGFAAWVMVTFAFYLIVSRRVIDPPYALSHPMVLINGLIGQNGFLTTGIFTAGAVMLRQRPLAAGAILGALIIKPQLALALPIAVVAARLWPAIGGALATIATLCLLSLAVFGTGVFTGLLQFLPLYAEKIRQETWPWSELISVFAFLRYFGVDQSVALTMHAVVAAAAGALTWIAWSRDWEEQVPILAAATLLLPPYLLTYDALLMIIPMGFWLKDQSHGRLAGLLWLLCFLPIAFYFGPHPGPNTIPLAAMIFIGVTVADRLRGKRLVTTNVDHAHTI